MTTATPTHRHIWKFNRIGGLDQVRLSTGADLLHLNELDPKLWVALSCPTKGLEFDQRTLDYIDVDKDGHIRVPELIAAVQWAATQLKDPGELLHPADALPLNSINAATDQGKALLASAKQILKNLGKPDAPAIALTDTADGPRIFHDTRFNGDGIITPFSAQEPELQKVIEEIMLVCGSVGDRTGKPGVDQARADAFFKALAEYRDWRNAEENCLPPDYRAKYPGDLAPKAFAAYRAVKTKIDDYFTRCRLAAYDGRAAADLAAPADCFKNLTPKNLAAELAPDGPIALLPLQGIAPGKPLDLTAPLNPAWAALCAQFRQAVAEPLLGAAEAPQIDTEEWARLTAAFTGYEAWFAGKKGALVEQLGIDRVRAILAANLQNKVNDLMAEDLKLAAEANAIDAVDKLVRYYKHLFRLLKNFVNFEEFYDTRHPGIFQLGTMYLDQRSFRLCVRVDDPGAHAAIASASRAFLIYCTCTRKGAAAEKMNLAVGITQGDADYIAVGRNGVFYDFKGNDWDATVVKIIENPISVKQAFWSPYRRFAKLIEEQIQKFASSKDKEVFDSAANAAAETTAQTAAGKPPAKPPFDIARFAGIFAAIGLAIGAIGGAIGAMLSAFFTLEWWQMPLAVIGISLVISGPSIVMAWFNLRKRILGPILEANGWAINGRVRINIPLGNSMTRLKELPPGALASRIDPFEDKAAKRRTWLYSIFTVAVLGALVYFFVVVPRLNLRREKEEYNWKAQYRTALPADRQKLLPPLPPDPDPPPPAPKP